MYIKDSAKNKNCSVVVRRGMKRRRAYSKKKKKKREGENVRKRWSISVFTPWRRAVERLPCVRSRVDVTGNECRGADCINTGRGMLKNNDETTGGEIEWRCTKGWTRSISPDTLFSDKKQDSFEHIDEIVRAPLSMTRLIYWRICGCLNKRNA